MEVWTLYRNENGTEIGVSSASVIERDGYVFKDPEFCGELRP